MTLDTSIAVYYFSGSGNSLVVARDIAAHGGERPIHVASIVDEEGIEPDADRIGIVFPVYHGGLPNIITRFVAKMRGLDGKYIFAVCTHGGAPGLAIKYLADCVDSRGGNLAAGFTVNMPFNYIGWSRKLREIPENKQQAMFEAWNDRLKSIITYVGSRKGGDFETSSDAIERLVDSLRLKETVGKRIWLRRAGVKKSGGLSFRESIALMDTGFWCDDDCDGCGICARICPVRDIDLVDGRPTWRHRCEQCFGCLQWCPREAIQFGDGTVGGRRYHHPGVRVKDMLRRD